MMWLLFDKAPVKPSVEEIKRTLNHKFGEVEPVSQDEELSSFAIKKIPFTF